MSRIILSHAEMFISPPAKEKQKVILELKSTKKYSKAFLDSLKKGMSRSSYFVNMDK